MIQLAQFFKIREGELRNLAGVADCDKYIVEELTRCRIELVRGERSKGEVATTVTGKLDGFTFRRAWYYWVVEGNVPLAVAQELYADPVGKTDIRVAGHCGCPPPLTPWIKWLDAEGHELWPLEQKPPDEVISRIGLRLDPNWRFVEDPSAEGFAFVDLYHIDSEIGLRVFIDTLIKHGIV